jgi:hypothetical protein
MSRPIVVGDQLLTWEDLDALDQCSTDELLILAEGGGGAVTLNWQDREKAISAARLLYARLLAGLIPPEEIAKTERVLTRLIDAGGWPWYKNDLKCIRLAIRGCGFMPGHPLKDQPAQSREQASA